MMVVRAEEAVQVRSQAFPIISGDIVDPLDILPDPFSALDNCCYMRKATMDGIEGYVLLDCDGEVEFFTDNRSNIFFHAAKHELVIVQPN